MTQVEDPMEWAVELPVPAAKRAAVLGFAILAGLIGWRLLGIPGLILGVAVVLGSTLEIWMAHRYILTSDKAESRIGPFVTSIEWPSVKRVIEGEEGVILSPFDKPTRLDAFRGVYLRFNSNQGEVLAKIRRLWRSDGATLGN